LETIHEQILVEWNEQEKAWSARVGLESERSIQKNGVA
jgi:hypothetical protein